MQSIASLFLRLRQNTVSRPQADDAAEQAAEYAFLPLLPHTKNFLFSNTT